MLDNPLASPSDSGQRKEIPDSIQTIGFELLEDIKPQLRDRHALIVELAREYKYSFAVYHETVLVPGDVRG